MSPSGAPTFLTGSRRNCWSKRLQSTTQTSRAAKKPFTTTEKTFTGSSGSSLTSDARSMFYQEQGDFSSFSDLWSIIKQRHYWPLPALFFSQVDRVHLVLENVLKQTSISEPEWFENKLKIYYRCTLNKNTIHLLTSSCSGLRPYTRSLLATTWTTTRTMEARAPALTVALKIGKNLILWFGIWYQVS